MESLASVSEKFIDRFPEYISYPERTRLVDSDQVRRRRISSLACRPRFYTHVTDVDVCTPYRKGATLPLELFSGSSEAVFRV